MNTSVKIVLIFFALVFGIMAFAVIAGNAGLFEIESEIESETTAKTTAETTVTEQKVRYDQAKCDLLVTMQRSLITNHMGIVNSLADTKAFTPNDKAMIDSIERTLITSAKGLEDYKVVIADHCY